MKIKNKKNKLKFANNDGFMLIISKIYLFPLYIVGVLLKFYDKVKVKLVNFVKYKVLKKKKVDKIEDWWIS